MNFLKVNSRYIRKHDCLLVDCDMSDYLIEYYLNSKDMGLSVDAQHDEQLKQYLACLAMHLTTRPTGESIAWTIHTPAATPYSLFLTGSTTDETLVGRVLYENVTATDSNILHSQVVREKGESSRSTVRSEDSSTLSMFENFYQQSEQIGAKLAFIENSDRAVCLFAMPGFDQEWFEDAKPEGVLNEIENFDYRLMREAAYRFYCDCSAEKLLPFFRSIDRDTLRELYQEDQSLIIDCPRCGKNFEIERSEVFED